MRPHQEAQRDLGLPRGGREGGRGGCLDGRRGPKRWEKAEEGEGGRGERKARVC